MARNPMLKNPYSGVASWKLSSDQQRIADQYDTLSSEENGDFGDNYKMHGNPLAWYEGISPQEEMELAAIGRSDPNMGFELANLSKGYSYSLGSGISAGLGAMDPAKYAVQEYLKKHRGMTMRQARSGG
jgi:hypothetical protein